MTATIRLCKTGWKMAIDPNTPDWGNSIAISPEGRTFYGSRESIEYLASSMDPPAAAWRRRAVEDNTDPTMRMCAIEDTNPVKKLIRKFSL